MIEPIVFIPSSWTHLPLYDTYPKIITSPIYHQLMGLKTAGVAYSVNLDQMPCYAVSDLGQHCLLKPVCPKTSDQIQISLCIHVAIGSDQGQPAPFFFI